MTILTYPHVTFASETDIVNFVKGIIGEEKTVNTTYNSDSGILYSLELPDSDQEEADAVDAAVKEAFPRETDPTRSA